MFGKCHFLPQSDSTGGGSSPFPEVVSCGDGLAPCPHLHGGARMTSTRAVTWSKAKKLPGNPFQKKLYFSSTQAGGGGVPLALLLCTELLLDAA